jgi:adenylosuccinate synthase
MVNGVTNLFMMKADVLNIFDEISVCTHYRLPNGALTDQMPFDLLETPVTPVYTQLKGWGATLPDKLTEENLPEALRQYIQFLEKTLQVPISLISLGPDRQQTIVKNF